MMRLSHMIWDSSRVARGGVKVTQWAVVRIPLGPKCTGCSTAHSIPTCLSRRSCGLFPRQYWALFPIRSLSAPNF